jgi:hypothetical protein
MVKNTSKGRKMPEMAMVKFLRPAFGLGLNLNHNLNSISTMKCNDYY